jgi:hypothetical protein
MTGAFEPLKRPQWMSDHEWLTTGLICLAQLSEAAHAVLQRDDPLETEVSMVSFGLFSNQMNNWLVADYEFRGFDLSLDEAKKLSIQLGEKMLDVRMFLFDLPLDEER